MRCWRVGLCLWSLVLVALAGCAQRLDKNLTVTVEPMDAFKEQIIDAPRSDQQVTVQISSPGVPVNGYLVLGKERQAVEAALQNSKAPTNLLASKEKTEEATLEGKVPAGSEFAILLTPASNKTAQVKLKITGH